MNASSTKPVLIVRYRELNRRLQMSSVCERIYILRKSIDSVLLGRTGGGA